MSRVQRAACWYMVYLDKWWILVAAWVVVAVVGHIIHG